MYFSADKAKADSVRGSLSVKIESWVCKISKQSRLSVPVVPEPNYRRFEWMFAILKFLQLAEGSLAVCGGPGEPREQTRTNANDLDR